MNWLTHKLFPRKNVSWQ